MGSTYNNKKNKSCLYLLWCAILTKWLEQEREMESFGAAPRKRNNASYGMDGMSLYLFRYVENMLEQVSQLMSLHKQAIKKS